MNPNKEAQDQLINALTARIEKLSRLIALRAEIAEIERELASQAFILPVPVTGQEVLS